MKILKGTSILAVVLALSFPAFTEARTWPAPTGYVNDLAGIIDAASADSMNALAQELDAKTGAQLAVVTIESLEGETIDPVAVELYHAWGIGSKQKDEGALILLARQERRVRIEVGYGLEGIIPDGRAGSIIRNVMGPDLHADRFGPGLLRGVQAIAAIVAADRGVTLDHGGAIAPPAGRGPDLFFVFFILMIVFGIVSRYINALRWTSSRRRRGWYDPWGGFGGGLGGMGGFGGSGGGGGGFGGFGGGGSGGGGASGGF